MLITFISKREYPVYSAIIKQILNTLWEKVLFLFRKVIKKWTEWLGSCTIITSNTSNSPYWCKMLHPASPDKNIAAIKGMHPIYLRFFYYRGIKAVITKVSSENLKYSLITPEKSNWEEWARTYYCVPSTSNTRSYWFWDPMQSIHVCKSPAVSRQKHATGKDCYL